MDDRALIPLIIIALTLTMVTATSTAMFSSWTVVRGQAELPCVVPLSTHPADKPLLTLWYKETQPTVPIYSYDTRSGPFSEGTRWTDKQHLGTRAYFRVVSEPPTLVVEDVKVADQAVYTCRVDYKVRASAITSVNLTVIVPPGPPIIFDGQGRQVYGTVGPLREGDHTQLTCGSAGGSPTPTLTWWRDGERLLQVGRQSEGGGVESRISVVASRVLHGAVLTCQALNNNITEPATTSLTLYLLLKPLSVEIVGGVEGVSAGVWVDLVCRVVGSRPPATITWWRGAHTNTVVNTTVLNGGNVTTGSIKFSPTRLDHGERVRCVAANPEIPNYELEDSVLLNVRFKPEVELAFGAALNPQTIKEGDDVYFDCTTHANPPVHRVSWFHNGEVLESNHSAGLIVSSASLVLQKVKRGRAGVYACEAQNVEGRGVSNSLSLNVMFAPVCSSPGKRTQGVARTESAQVACQVNAFPTQVNFTWRFNGSSEGKSLPPHAIQSQGTSSHLNYTAAREQDYGTLLCWAHNTIGSQNKPCIIHLIPAGPPKSPRNCSITNQTEEVLVVECRPGPDGGLPQHFVMEAWHEGVLLSNTTSLAPEFVVRGLEPGMGVKLTVRAINNRGKSAAVTLDVDVMKVAEKRMGPPEEGVLIPPVIGGVVGGVVVVVVLVVGGLLLVHYTHHCRPHTQAAKERSPPKLTNVYARESHEESDPYASNPDIIKGTGGVCGTTGGGRSVEAVLLQGDTVAGINTTISKDEEFTKDLSSAETPTDSRGDNDPSLYPGHIPNTSQTAPTHHLFSQLPTHTPQPNVLPVHPNHSIHPHLSIHPSHVPHSVPMATYPSLSIHPSHRPISPPESCYVLDPGDLGAKSPQYCMTGTTSLHDLTWGLPSSHHDPLTQHSDGVSTYGTLRSGGGTQEQVGGPLPSNVVSTFLATSHQESAV